MLSHTNILVGTLATSILSCLAGDIIIGPDDDECRSLASCSSCLTQSTCTWCVAKSICTQQFCGNDNVIYPQHVLALLAGSDFCPRVIESETPIFKSGTKDVLIVKITQIYIYMAFTPWTCEIHLNGKDTNVPAVLIGESVYCESIEMQNESENPYEAGTVKVFWNYNKAFDGSLSFKVCRCDIDPNCVACKRKEERK